MKHTRRLATFVGAALCILGLFAGESLAQADFQQGFDNNGPTQEGDHGPINLIDQGWIFRNQSEPLGWSHWTDNLLQNDPPQTGASCIGASVWNVNGAGIISNWMILPAVASQQEGDILTFYVDGSQSWSDGLQVRYSPSGGTDTGSGAEDVGDFEELLLDLYIANGNWAEHSCELPGSGRIAFRRYLNPGGPQTPFGTYLRIDTLSIAPVDPPDQPIEETWFAADNPHVIGGIVVIPENVIVTVEPGVIIEVSPQSTLQIDGMFIGQGTEAEPIMITGGWSWITPPVRVNGTLELHFANMTGLIWGESGSSMLIADSQFPQGEVRTRESGPLHDPKYVRIERCTFTEGGNVRVTDGMLAISDSTFEASDGVPAPLDGSLSLLRGHLRVDNVTLDGGRLRVFRERSPQISYINNVTVLNNTERAAMDLYGWDFALGSGNVLENNLYPVHIASGFTPDSTIPATGNVNNFILVGDENPDDGLGLAGVRGQATWPDLGVPYVVNGYQTSGNLTILPGVTVQFTGNSLVIAESTRRFVARGLPDAPITFQRFDPASVWDGIGFVANTTGPRLEHCVIEGATAGTIASDTQLMIDSCLLRNNGVGSNSNTFGRSFIRKTRLFDNGVGAQGTAAPIGNGEPDLFGLTLPNWIEGNGIGVQGLNGGDEIEARHNYWGDPSGPTTPLNPGGTGDPVEGSINFSPFETSPPDFKDTPPVVDLAEPYFLAESGEKIIINWQAEDDSQIVSQRVLFSAHGIYEYEVVADDLPASQRSFEFTVPVVMPSSINNPSFIKVVSIDEAGQEGWDHASFDVPYTADVSGTLAITSDLTGPFVMSERIDVCWQPLDGAFGGIDAAVFLDGDEHAVDLGGAHTGVACVSSYGRALPYVSTDLARLGLRLSLGAGNRFVWVFSDYFEIRPDARIDDSPPDVVMLTPQHGESYEGGETVPITWTASDDDLVRSFDIQGSFDGGRTWHPIVSDLPAETSGYDWKLPPSSGIPDVRVRVVAKDLQYQNSSDGTDVVFSITPGEGGVMGDLDGDGNVGPADLAILLGSWGPCGDCGDCPADLDGDCTVGAADLAILLGSWG